MSEEVRDNPDESRFEIYADGRLAGFAAYRRHGAVADFTHTQVDDEFEGRGLGSRLIRGALDASRADGQQVRPYCPFVKDFIAKHADYVDLVPADARAGFGLGS
jgi:predicted GNAT family acetyltransferase